MKLDSLLHALLPKDDKFFKYFEKDVENLFAAARVFKDLMTNSISKEERARDIARQDGVNEGLICVFSAVESCFSYEVRRDPDRRLLELRGRPQKCLHYYFYLQHPQFGFMHLRLQTWFPLNIHVAINGREWLARRLDAAGIGYPLRPRCTGERLHGSHRAGGDDMRGRTLDTRTRRPSPTRDL